MAEVTYPLGPLEFGQDKSLQYMYSPQEVQAVLNSDGLPASLRQKIDSFLGHNPDLSDQAAIHYVIPENNTGAIAGAAVIHYHTSHKAYGPSLISTNFGEINWDATRRAFEIIGNTNFPDSVSLVFDFSIDPEAHFRQMNLSLMWNQDMITFLESLLSSEKMNELHVVGLAEGDTMRKILFSVGKTVSMTLPKIRDRIFFDD